MNTPEQNTPEEHANGADESVADNSGTENTDAAKDRSDETPGTDRRPLGFWLRVVDARLTREFHAILEPDGLDRRDWMILNAIAGTVDREPLAGRLERGGRRLRALVARGWVAGEPGSWSLTDEGRLAFERIGGKVSAFRARVAGAASPEDFASTLATLEAIAAELGGDGEDFGRFGRGRRGFGRGFGPGYGPGFGWGRGGRGFERGEGAGMHPHHGHGHNHGGPEHGHRHGGPEHGHRHGACGHADDHGPAREAEASSTATPTSEV